VIVSVLCRSVDLIKLQRLVVHNVDRSFFGTRRACVDPDVGRRLTSLIRPPADRPAACRLLTKVGVGPSRGTYPSSEIIDRRPGRRL
jgi:hypothetical protein